MNLSDRRFLASSPHRNEAGACSTEDDFEAQDHKPRRRHTAPGLPPAIASSSKQHVYARSEDHNTQDDEYVLHGGHRSDLYEESLQLAHDLSLPYRSHGLTNNNTGSGHQMNHTQAGRNNQQNNANIIIIHEGGHDVVKEIAEWLSGPDPWIDNASILRQRVNGTCEWLLKCDQYKKWKSNVIRHLWLHGKTGCGKSFLCATAIEDLREHCITETNVGLAIFYFSFSDSQKQSYDNLLHALLRQLALKEPALTSLRQVYEKLGRRMLSTDESESVLCSVMGDYKQMQLVLDGLDECPEGSARLILRRLELLAERVASLKLFLVSRELEDIRLSMQTIQAEMLPVATSVADADIRLYLTRRLDSDQQLLRFNADLKALVQERISQRSDGMFGWASLQLDALGTLRTTRPSSIEKALRNLPPSLNDTYARILNGIQGEDNRKNALTLLYWLAYARRPCSLQELTDTMIIDIKEAAVDFDDRGHFTDVPNILSSLITTIRDNEDGQIDIDSAKQNAGSVTSMSRVSIVHYDRVNDNRNLRPDTKIQLAHSSVKEYLESQLIRETTSKDLHLESRLGHHVLAQSCLAYIMRYSDSDQKTFTMHDLQTFPLLEYASKSWYHHSLEHQSTDISFETRFLSSTAAITDWLKIHMPDKPTAEVFNSESGARIGDGLYYASHSGLKLVVNKLLNNGADVNAKGGEYANALHAASRQGHTEVVKVLLDSGADSCVRDAKGRTPLFSASCEGHLEVVKLLRGAGAEDDITHVDGWTAINAASYNGHVEVVKLLLNACGDAQVPNKVGMTPLYSASYKGHIEIVKLLQAAGSSIHTASDRGWTAIHAASVTGHLEMVKLLLEAGSNISTPNEGGWTPINTASKSGHLEVVKLLLESGANINTPNNNGWTPINSASGSGHLEVVKLLIEAGGNVDTPNKNGWTPINTVSGLGDVELVKLLLEAGGNMHTPNNEGWTPINNACHEGHLEVVAILLEAGGNMNTASNNGTTPIHAASDSGHLDLVKLLLGKGADVNAARDFNGSALQSASCGGHSGIVRLLLNSGADVNAKGGSLGNALQAASYNGHIEIVKLLLAKDAQVNAYSGKYNNAYTAARLGGHEDVSDLLHEKGAIFNVDAADSLGRTFLHLSAIANSCEGIMYAMDHGLDLNAKDNSQWTALHWGTYFGSVEAVKLLLDRRADHTLTDWQNRTPYEIARLAGRKVASKFTTLFGFQDEDSKSPIHEQDLNGYCNSCKISLVKQQHHCTICPQRPGYDLCFRCVRDVETIHPGHAFIDSFRY